MRSIKEEETKQKKKNSLQTYCRAGETKNRRKMLLLQRNLASKDKL
jgi:hypothetical protein